MSDAAAKLLPLLDVLTAADRNEVRAYLDGLDGDGDESLSPEEWEAAWAAECDRRIADLEAGRTKLVSHEEFLAFWKERYG